MMNLKRVAILSTGTIFSLHSAFFGGVSGQTDSFGDCITTSNATLFATSAQYADAYTEFFDSDISWLNFVQCQTDFLEASVAYNETCELDRDSDTMFNTFVTACRKAGGDIYVGDSAFQCIKLRNSINVVDKKLPRCVLPEVTSCGDIDSVILSFTPESFAAYTDRGYDCEGTSIDFYLYNEPVITQSPSAVDEGKKTDPPNPTGDSYVQCLDTSNTTLFSTSDQYAEAYNEFFDSGILWQNFNQCQADFLTATVAYTETCELDREADSMFITFVNACQQAGGDVYVEDSAFQCSDAGYSITVVEKNLPRYVLPEVTSCGEIDSVSLSFIPEAFAAYTDRGYECEGTQLDFYRYDQVDSPTPYLPTTVSPKTDPPTPIGDSYVQCIDTSNTTLFSTSDQYAEAYTEFFDSDILWLNFVQCQADFLTATVAYTETCELNREGDSMFNTFVNACQEAGGDVYVEDSSFQCSSAGYSITVVERNLPRCVLPEVTSCGGIDSVSLSFIPEAFAAYTDRGYYCQGTQLDFYRYIERDPPTTVPPTTRPTSDVEPVDCFSASNATLFSTSTQYADAYAEFFDRDELWQTWRECQEDFAGAFKPYDETCELDREIDPSFNTFVDACEEAFGVILVVDSAFECAKAGFSINVIEKKFPYCILPETKSCQGIEDAEPSMTPNAIDAYNDLGYYCQLKQLEINRYERDDITVRTTPPETDEQDSEDELGACISSSNKKLFDVSPQYKEAYSEMIASDEESDNWIKCQTDFLDEPQGNNGTCEMDYKEDYIYETFLKECEEAGGTRYLLSSVFECSKTGNKVDIVQKNNPVCIVPYESLCKEVLKTNPDVQMPLSDDFTEAGYSCSSKIDFYPMNDGPTPAHVEEADDSNMPIIIGIVIAFIIAAVGIIGFVFYIRRQRQRSQSERNASSVIEQEDAQKKRMNDAMAQQQANHSAVAGYDASSAYPTNQGFPTVPANNVQVLEDVSVLRPSPYYDGPEA